MEAPASDLTPQTSGFRETIYASQVAVTPLPGFSILHREVKVSDLG